jgi:hypothetical protein
MDLSLLSRLVCPISRGWVGLIGVGANLRVIRSLGNDLERGLERLGQHQHFGGLDIHHAPLISRAHGSSATQFKRPKTIMPDLLHPNEKGYQLWADAIEPTLAAMLK